LNDNELSKPYAVRVPISDIRMFKRKVHMAGQRLFILLKSGMSLVPLLSEDGFDGLIRLLDQCFSMYDNLSTPDMQTS
jgi:hypothetical protein